MSTDWWKPNCEIINVSRTQRFQCSVENFVSLKILADVWFGYEMCFAGHLFLEESGEKIYGQEEFEVALEKGQLFMYVGSGEKWGKRPENFNYSTVRIIESKPAYVPPAIDPDVIEKIKQLGEDLVYKNPETWKKYHKCFFEAVSLADPHLIMQESKLDVSTMLDIKDLCDQAVDKLRELYFEGDMREESQQLEEITADICSWKEETNGWLKSDDSDEATDSE